MDILLAQPRGFCAGVNRAITIVKKALDYWGAPVYVLHEIVHNTHVLQELRLLGAVFVEEMDQIPAAATVVFSAHGVPRAVQEQAKGMGLRTIDATCPLVAKVHRRIVRLHQQGHNLIVIGHKGHPEVVGTCGQIQASTPVISRAAEVATLPFGPETALAYVTQTTLSVDDTQAILSALRRRFPRLIEPGRSDICYATTNRQAAVRELAQQTDMMLIVGSKNSSNSNRLREAAATYQKTAYLIDDASEIDPGWLEGVERLGLSAGASAPEHLVQEVIHRLQQLRPGVVEEMAGEEEEVIFFVSAAECLGNLEQSAEAPRTELDQQHCADRDAHGA